MKSFNIPENTQGNKEGLIEARNDQYADNQPWDFLGPGIGENRSYPCSLHQFEIAGLYIDYRLATDKYKFNILGVQPWHFYEKGEYRDAMEWLLKNRKPSKIRTTLLSLGNFGFFNNTSPEDAAFVMDQSYELTVIVPGPPADHKAYREDVIKVVADSGKPIHIYSSVNDIHDGTSYVYAQKLHDQLKAAGANVTITMYSPGFGHNGTALNIWKGKDFYKLLGVPVAAPVPVEAPPVIIPDPVPDPVITPIPDPVVTPVETPPVVVPDPVTPPVEVPSVVALPRELQGYNITGDNIKIQIVYGNADPRYIETSKGDDIKNFWIPKAAFDKPTVKRLKTGAKQIDTK